MFPLRNDDHAQFTVGAVLPTRVAEIARELPDFAPVAFGREDVPFEVDVAFDGEPAKPQPAILFRQRRGEIRGNLFRNVRQGKDLHLTAQPTELRVHRVAAIAGFARRLLDFDVDGKGVVPVGQPGQAVGFGQSRGQVARRTLGIRDRGKQQRDERRLQKPLPHGSTPDLGWPARRRTAVSGGG